MTNIPKTKECILELKDNWLTIWFNRPNKRNALSKRLLNEIGITLSSIENDRSIRGVIFRGKNKVFCSGMDLEEIKDISLAGEKAREKAIGISRIVGSTFEQINKAPQITVSAVEGAGMAGGFGIACATDILVSMSDAKYALTETKIGLTPVQIAPYIINRLGYEKARKLMLFGTAFNGKKAFKIGMADYLAETIEEFETHLNDVKDMVLQCSPIAVSLTKRVLSENSTLSIEESAKLFASSLVDGDGFEGLASFFEKRRPRWSIDSKSKK